MGWFHNRIKQLCCCFKMVCLGHKRFSTTVSSGRAGLHPGQAGNTTINLSWEATLTKHPPACISLHTSGRMHHLDRSFYQMYASECSFPSSLNPAGTGQDPACAWECVLTEARSSGPRAVTRKRHLAMRVPSGIHNETWGTVYESSKI